MVEKELKFRMLGGVCRMVRFFPTGDCGRIPRLWSQPRVLELLGRCLEGGALQDREELLLKLFDMDEITNMLMFLSGRRVACDSQKWSLVTPKNGRVCLQTW